MKRNSFSTLIVLVFSACSNNPAAIQSPAPLQPTKIQLQIEANSELNLDAAGNASPVIFRVYELRDTGSFSNADFFVLMEKDQTLLTTDLSRKHEFTLKMGESKTLALTTSNDVKSLCFLAVFRKLDDAKWRSCNELTAQHEQKIIVKIKNNQLITQAESDKTPH